ncbi:DUF6264 family protein [Microbacterium sulfonylureivorans]|uniref:DUF6264 family protein n=1 Tax=Microbacterium sulfonylureivorans TaxID=2486854 RepID=UPI000FD72E60|nr:DUF6264 family protein [Microbacterium sulfonylureivorans]
MTGAGSAAASQDPRPRPQYGEYASPEEQRAHIREPAATWAYEPNAATQATAAPTAPAVAPAPSAGAAAEPRTRPRAVDRIVTFALLAYGLINVVSAFPALVDFVAYADTMFDLLGVDATLTDPAAGKPWGIAAALVLAFGWVLTAGLSWLSMRRGRLSWWIPLVGGVVFTLASGMLVLVPIMNDPAVWDALVSSVR